MRGTTSVQCNNRQLDKGGHQRPWHDFYVSSNIYIITLLVYTRGRYYSRRPTPRYPLYGGGKREREDALSLNVFYQLKTVTMLPFTSQSISELRYTLYEILIGVGAKVCKCVRRGSLNARFDQVDDDGRATSSFYLRRHKILPRTSQVSRDTQRITSNIAEHLRLLALDFFMIKVISRWREKISESIAPWIVLGRYIAVPSPDFVFLGTHKRAELKINNETEERERCLRPCPKDAWERTWGIRAQTFPWENGRGTARGWS